MEDLDYQIGNLVGMLKMFVEANGIEGIKGEENYEVLYILLKAKYGSEADIPSIINNLLA